MSDLERRPARNVPLRVFVSYSRRDFHFAEAAAATLGRNRTLDPWLDAERLQPWILGQDARREPRQRRCAAPIGIARGPGIDSREAGVEPRALSPHPGLRRCRQGHVKATRLPDELARCPVYDLRCRFWQRTTELGWAVAVRDTTSPTAAPQPNQLRLPGRVPIPVAILATVSVINVFALSWATMLMLGFATPFIGSRRTTLRLGPRQLVYRLGRDVRSYPRIGTPCRAAAGTDSEHVEQRECSHLHDVLPGHRMRGVDTDLVLCQSDSTESIEETRNPRQRPG